MNKKTFKTVIIGLVAIVVIGVGAFYTLSPKTYDTAKVVKSDIQEIISETGTIVSNKQKTYYADTDIVVKGLNLKVGHTAKIDTVLMTYMKVADIYEEELSLTSDFTGVVTECYIEEGEYIKQGSPLFVVADNNNLSASIELSSDNLENIEVGQKANITCGEKTYAGSVYDIKEVAVKTDGKPKINVDVQVSTDAEMIYLGSEVDVDIFAVAKDSVLVVPIEAVYSDADNDYVYCIENNVIVKKAVKTGISSDKYTEIKEGLSTNDTVITGAVNDSDRGTKAISK